MATFSVWVGGVEINAYYLNKQDAERLAEAWRASDYDDVIVREEVSA